jgi:hypothetical protein
MSDEHEADHTDPGLDREIGEGYPEEQPAGAGGGARAPDEDAEEPPGAPDAKPHRDSEPRTATGNPHAAG